MPNGELLSSGSSCPAAAGSLEITVAAQAVGHCGHGPVGCMRRHRPESRGAIAVPSLLAQLHQPLADILIPAPDPQAGLLGSPVLCSASEPLVDHAAVHRDVTGPVPPVLKAAAVCHPFAEDLQPRRKRLRSVSSTRNSRTGPRTAWAVPTVSNTHPA